LSRLSAEKLFAHLRFCNYGKVKKGKNRFANNQTNNKLKETY